jgi:hypothetical protein
MNPGIAVGFLVPRQMGEEEKRRRRRRRRRRGKGRNETMARGRQRGSKTSLSDLSVRS